jgi:ABC-type oligopeptide transport system substrate-binding subunit
LGIKAVGKYKLVITLERRIPYFDKLMGFAVFFPQSEKAVKKLQYGFQVHDLQRSIRAKGLDRVQSFLEDG